MSLRKTDKVLIETLNGTIIERTENLPDDPADQSILAGEHSVIYTEAEIIERHLHSNERWYEKAAVPVGETHVADRIGTVGGLGAFIMDAGNNTWGNWILILGSEDTPADLGRVAFDLHRIEISAAERNSVYYVQFAAGETGAAALLAGTMTELVIKPLSNQIDAGPMIGQSEKALSGTKIWARCMCPGFDTATLNFFPGVHEYNEIE